MLTARFERIRAECFQHPVGQAWLKQIDAEVQRVIKRLVEEALVQELNAHLGFERYERTGAAKPALQHRSGTWGRSLRTLWGEVEIRVPKLRKGNRERPWQVLVRYERNFGPWLDLQLHLYRLGLSQYDLQEILHLGFGQVLSPKAVQHLTAVAQREMEAFRQAPLDDTPPVMIVDGVHVKVLLPTGTYRINRRGHRREVKRRAERVILAASGVWPDGRHRVLYFEMVDQETKAHWKQFFRNLMAKGLDPDLELAVYRIAQEALNNVSRHAQASQASVILAFEGGGVMLSVEDDGVGFEVPERPAEVAQRGHFGLVGMRERALLCGGRLTIESRADGGKGTRVSAHFPRTSPGS